MSDDALDIEVSAEANVGSGKLIDQKGASVDFSTDVEIPGAPLTARSKTAPCYERAGFGQISTLISLNRQAIRLNQDENLPQISTLSRRHLFLNGLLTPVVGTTFSKGCGDTGCSNLNEKPGVYGLNVGVAVNVGGPVPVELTAEKSNTYVGHANLPDAFRNLVDSIADKVEEVLP